MDTSDVKLEYIIANVQERLDAMREHAEDIHFALELATGILEDLRDGETDDLLAEVLDQAREALGLVPQMIFQKVGHEEAERWLQHTGLRKPPSLGQTP